MTTPLLIIAAVLLIGIALYRKRFNPLWLTVLTVGLNVFYLVLLMFIAADNPPLLVIGLSQGCLFAWYCIRDLLGLPKERTHDY